MNIKNLVIPRKDLEIAPYTTVNYYIIHKNRKIGAEQRSTYLYNILDMTLEGNFLVIETSNKGQHYLQREIENTDYGTDWGFRYAIE